jgi:hypothetical protein
VPSKAASVPCRSASGRHSREADKKRPGKSIPINYLGYISGGTNRSRNADPILGDPDAGGAPACHDRERVAGGAGWPCLTNLPEAGSLEEHKIGLRSLHDAIDTTTPSGKLTSRILGAPARFERILIRYRAWADREAARAMADFAGISLGAWARRRRSDLRAMKIRLC